jgi:hypothetical protein
MGLAGGYRPNAEVQSLEKLTFTEESSARRTYALALAFGIGGRDRAAALLERWFPRRDDGDGH